MKSGEVITSDEYEVRYDSEGKKFVIVKALEFEDEENPRNQNYTNENAIVAEFPERFNKEEWLNKLFPERNYDGFYSPGLGEDNSWLQSDILGKAGITFIPQMSAKRLEDLNKVVSTVTGKNDSDEFV